MTTTYQMAYPVQPDAAGNTLTVTISGTIAANKTTTFTNHPVVFKKALEHGGSYVLQINFRKALRWAGSHIYWEESLRGGTGALTFAPTGTPHSDERQRYIGLFFRWGSLIGTSITTNDLQYHYYIPTYYNSSSNSWTDFWNYDSYWSNDEGTTTSVPYITTNDATSDDPGSDYFENPAHSDYANKLGDICRYLTMTGDAPAGHSYRMPTANELYYGTVKGSAVTNPPPVDPTGWASGIAAGNWTPSWGNGANPNEATHILTGKLPNNRGANYNGVAFFSAFGYRNHINGLYNRLTYGYVWTASACGTNNGLAYEVEFSDSHVAMTFDDCRIGFPVRCIVDE
jgi:hypothetical protein